MGFQTTVNTYPAGAVAGDRASQNATIYWPCNFLAGGTVKVGGFVWRDSNSEDEVVASGSGAPMGFVERTMEHFKYDLTAEGTLSIAEGGNVAVAIKGDFLVKADGAVTAGATVYCKTTDGSVTFTSGANTVDTGYRAVKAAANGELVAVSNWFTAQGIAGVLGIANGGTGLSALGTAGQVLKVNSGATAAEWANA